MRILALLGLACLTALDPVAGAGAGPPSLLIPAHPDSAPPESSPAPLLTPIQPRPVDTTTVSLAARAAQEFRLGQALESQHQPGAAIIAYRNALLFRPDIPEANYRMGKLFLTVNQVAEAMRCFAAEVERHPENEDAARELGLALARLGDPGRGITQLERLARRHPADGRNWHALGFAYRSAHRPRDAEAALRRAIRLPPADPEELRDLGSLLAAQGRTSEARVEFGKALALAPHDPSTWFDLGNLESRGGRIDSALACYRRAESFDTSFALAYQAQIQLLRKRGRLAEAGTVYRRWLGNDPKQHGARLEAVQLYTQLGLPNAAREIAEQGVAKAGDEGQSHVILGVTLSGQGRTREALVELRRAEALFRTQPAEGDRVRALIERMRASAPDSLRAVFASDSLANARRRR